MSNPNAPPSKGKRVKHVPGPNSWIAKPRKFYNPNLELNFENPEQARKWNELTQSNKRKHMVYSLDLHLPTLFDFGITHCVKDPLEKSCMFIENVIGMKSYDRLVEEFFSTFEVVEGRDGTWVGWKFRMQNQTFKLTKMDICRTFGFDPNGIYPSYSEDMRLNFWKDISELGGYDPNCSAKCIMEGHWKYLHRLIALNINPRRDEGSRVSRGDLDLMLALSLEVPIDYFRVFTERFIRMSDPKEKNRALGCTSLITSLAISQRFYFHCPEDAFRSLDTTRMLKMGMIDPKEKRWTHEPHIPEKKVRKKDKGPKFYWHLAGDAGTSREPENKEEELPSYIDLNSSDEE